MTAAQVALCQFGGTLDHAENLRAAEHLIREAGERGARLVCLPELSNTVYMPFENDPRHFAQAEPVSGASVCRMQEIARQTGTMVVYPFFEVADGCYFNSAVIIGPDGNIDGAYRKSSIPARGLYPQGSERFYFSAGDLPLRVFETPWGFRFGVVICYERNLPEPARCLALAGADLLLVPVATVDVVRPWWQLLLRAHAVFNIFYVGACNKVGLEPGGAPGTRYFGSSLAVDPRGEVLATGSDREPEIVMFGVDLDLLAGQRERWSFLADRRPDMYGALVEQADGRPGPAGSALAASR